MRLCDWEKGPRDLHDLGDTTWYKLSMVLYTINDKISKKLRIIIYKFYGNYFGTMIVKVVYLFKKQYCGY